MKTAISDTPTANAAAYIEEKLLLHQDETILFFISGGSALCVLDALSPQTVHASITVAFVDDRFTSDQKGNNYLQLQQTNFYKQLQKTATTWVESSPLENESYEQFIKRIDLVLKNYFIEHPNVYVLGIFGIGEDGHTASIFPAPEKDFIETYQVEDLYIEATAPTSTYKERGSITPRVIEEYIDDVVLYAVGENKCDTILNYMHNKNFAIHQIPALLPAQHPQSILFTDCKALI